MGRCVEGGEQFGLAEGWGERGGPGCGVGVRMALLLVLPGLMRVMVISTMVLQRIMSLKDLVRVYGIVESLV